MTQPESVSQDGRNLLRPDKSDVIALQVTRIERIHGKRIAKSNLNSHTGIVISDVITLLRLVPWKIFTYLGIIARLRNRDFIEKK